MTYLDSTEKRVIRSLARRWCGITPSRIELADVADDIDVRNAAWDGVRREYPPRPGSCCINEFHDDRIWHLILVAYRARTLYGD